MEGIGLVPAIDHPPRSLGSVATPDPLCIVQGALDSAHGTPDTVPGLSARGHLAGGHHTRPTRALAALGVQAGGQIIAVEGTTDVIVSGLLTGSLRPMWFLNLLLNQTLWRPLWLQRVVSLTSAWGVGNVELVLH